MELGKSRKSSHSSPASTATVTATSTSSSTTKGVQKFYTKIRHKIEDLPPRLSAKLHKNSKHQSPSGLTSSSPNGKFTPLTNANSKTTKSTKTNPQKLVTKYVQTSPIKENRKNKDLIKNPKPKEDSVYEEIQVVSSNPNGSASIVYVDSDEECRLSLNDSKISLEDEIFEELEKVAHDEAKLNAVLKNFDKILTDFSSQAKQPNDNMHCKSLNVSLPAVVGSSANTSLLSQSITPSPKKLQKSKTCSIIESRCILKKCISDPQDDAAKLEMGLRKPSNFNTTKSLWNLKDFEDFAKSGKKLEKIENCKLPVYTGLNKSVGSASAVSHRSSPPVQQKIASGRSKSVWDMSGSTLSIAGGRSKIPIMKSSSILSLSSRSNSFCDVQKPRSPPNVSKIVKNINEKSPGPTKMFNSATSTPKMSLSSPIATNQQQQRRRNLASAVSTPHSLNRIEGLSTPKSSAITRSTIKPASSEVSLKKFSTPSRLTPLRKPQSSDVLLDKCLEKGHEILRKVEAIGSVSKIERKNRPTTMVNSKKSPLTSPAGSVSKKSSNSPLTSSSSPRNYARIKEQSTAKVLKEKNLKPADKKMSPTVKKQEAQVSASPPKSQDTIDGTLAASTDHLRSKSPVHLLYAKEESFKFPRLESCKIIPPILGNTSEEHAELLVNVKTKQPAIETPTTTILIEKLCNNELLQLENSPPHHDKHLYPDSDHDSDDSGHISNENDELLTIASGDCSSSSRSSDSSKETSPPPTPPAGIPSNHHQQHQRVVAASTKISELLEKFEITNNNSSTNLHRQQMLHHHHQHHSQHPAPPSPPSPISSRKICTAMKIAEVEPVKCIQTHIEIFPTYSKEVLFRSGVLSQLEAKRDELLSDRIIQLQAYCRGYLARKRVSQRRVQEIAVRCIQRNVKAFLTVRDWPWWRLLIRVQPLLNVHRTEEQLKSASDELHILRAKLEKIENDRNALKTENEKLENKLSEMTVDLAEERSGSHMASERLEAETAERLKLEKELLEQQGKVKNLQETSEKLEMELICAKSELNGISEDDDPDNEDSGGVYRLKYERVARELEFTKRRLQSQHEHDLEQLVGLKKQLEKKLSDAYEEVEEQRQVVGQWKRKAQKMTNEMSDLRMLLEEQNGRNNLLEKKQRKFDSECLALQDAARLERQSKDRLSREKDVLIAEKFTLEQNLADTRLELDLKEEKLASLQRELEEMTFGGGTEEEIAQLRRSKMDMDRRLKEQEEELDEMAGQVQLLEQAKLRLEMTLETMRKDARREAQQRDDELEEARGSAYKKIKALECQLETEHEERTLLLREKHELERRLSAMEDQDRVDRQTEEAITQKLKRDLRKYKALLKDAHAQLERLKADSPGKTLIRQLRNQLEDAESTRSLAVKARQTAEAELAEVQAMFEESQRARNDAEDRATASQRDRAELQAQIEENEEEMAELMKKYSTTVKQLNTEQIAMSEYEFRISELEAERNSLKDNVSELQQRLENVENMSDPSAAMLSKRLEIRTKELESRLELEQATRSRLEVQITRHKEAVEKIQNEVTQSKMRELNAQDALKKSQKCLRELREEFHVISNREQESITRRKDLEKKLENAESEAVSLRNDLRLALQRITDLQQAMEEGDDDVSESDESDTSDGSLSDLEERLKPIQVKRSPISTKNKETTNGVGGSNGSSDTTLVIREKKSENSPRITLTSPSTTSVSGNTNNSISNSLNNGESSYA
ncbi:myosin-2 heavy chain isoform X5 [Eupeodes corollae]|uniref:myosin-2 heavy chain isoform X5 n=1 Tax=Eupeodes corollae TaxID=290404 RepID=UPI00248F8C42|nr:myosin-2 heavy chain isoform X5 [Eupeodes corollae]